MSTPSLSPDPPDAPQHQSQCAFCRGEVPHLSRYCPHCGSPVTPETPPPPDYSARPWGPVRLTWSGKPLKPEVASILVGVSTLALIVFGAFFWRTYRDRPATPKLVSTENNRPSARIDKPSFTPLPPLDNPALKTTRPTSPSPLPDNGSANRTTSKSSPTPSRPEPPVPEPPQIVSFTADPSSIETGASTVLKWQAKGTGAVRIDPGIGPVAYQGEQPVSPTETTRYVVSSLGPGGKDSKSIVVSVAAIPKPVIAAFQLDPSEVRVGSQATLRWSVTGRTSNIRIEPGDSGLAASGEMRVSPATTTQYTLTATGPGGEETSQRTLLVAALPLPSISFAAEPAAVRLGQTTTLRWNVTDAEKVIMEPSMRTLGPTGTLTLKPLANTTYLLRATGPGGTAERKVTVSVSAPAGPLSGKLVWTGVIHGTEFVTIEKNRSDKGYLQGDPLPGLPCLVELQHDGHKVSFVSTPQEQNNYDSLILRITANGPLQVSINWSVNR